MTTPTPSTRAGVPHRKAYSYGEAAELLGIGKSLLRELVAAGELLAFSVSTDPHTRSLRISDSELERFITEREQAAAINQKSPHT